jgi:membrane protein
MERLLLYGDEVLPPDAASLLTRTLEEIDRGASGGLISVGALGILWAASRGIRSLIAALNVVYAVPTARPWWRRQLVAMVLTVAFCLFTLTALLLLGFGQRIGLALAGWLGLGVHFTAAWSVLQWPLALALGILGLDLAYYLAPAARPRWTGVTPGAVLAVVGWLLVALALRLWVSHIGDYNATYGSIGAVIVLMLWLYLSGAVVLIGGKVNAIIAHAEEGRLTGGWSGSRAGS